MPKPEDLEPKKPLAGEALMDEWDRIISSAECAADRENQQCP